FGHHPAFQILATSRADGDDAPVALLIPRAARDGAGADPVRQGKRGLLAAAVLPASGIAELPGSEQPVHAPIHRQIPTTLMIVKVPCSTTRLGSRCSQPAALQSTDETRKSANPRTTMPKLRAMMSAPATPVSVPIHFAAWSKLDRALGTSAFGEVVDFDCASPPMVKSGIPVCASPVLCG